MLTDDFDDMGVPVGIESKIRQHKKWLFPLAAIMLGLAAVPLVLGVLTGPPWALGLAVLIVIAIIAVTRR